MSDSFVKNILEEEFEKWSDPQASLWEEDPVDLDTFVTSSSFCGHPPLTPAQREDVIAILGEDPKLVFSRESRSPFQMGVLEYGKGGGKDTIASLVQAYVCYILLCMRDPVEYFRLGPGSTLDILNVAPAGQQAESIYFHYFAERIKGCAWFRENFDVAESGKLLDKRKKYSKGQINIGARSCIFPKGIRAFSLHSAHTSYEGYNVIFFVLDEYSAFTDSGKRANAPEVYRLLRTSATSRFGPLWKGFILSFPRNVDELDFTTQKLKECGNLGGTNPTLYGARRCTWEVAPRDRFCGQTFDFVRVLDGRRIELRDIPVEFKIEFDEDPYDALAKYATIVLRSQNRLFGDISFLDRISPREPIFRTQTIIVENPVGGDSFRALGKEIVDWSVSPLDRRVPHVIHIDLGLTSDSAALMIGHGEPVEVQVNVLDADGVPRVNPDTGEPITKIETIMKVVEDAHIVWKPQEGLPVSVQNVEEVLLEICEQIKVIYVSADQWNSAHLLEALSRKGIKAETHTINREDYIALKQSLEAGYVDLLASDLIVKELSNLEDTGKRVDHPLRGSKDLADCLAGIHRALNYNKLDVIRRLRPNKLVVRAAPAFAHKAPSDVASPFLNNLPFSSAAGPRIRGKARSIIGVSLGRRKTGDAIVQRFR